MARARARHGARCPAHVGLARAGLAPRSATISRACPQARRATLDRAANLILGLAAGYHYGDVRPFAVSLERTGFGGRRVLFVSSTTRDLARIEAHGIETIPFERPPDLAHVPYNAFRYFLYLDFLRASSGRFGRILLTDVRDVVFQRDPMDRPWPDGLNVALEDPRMTVGRCPYTARWLAGHLGQAALDMIADRPISCSGTILGSHEAVLRYLEALAALLLPFNPGKHMAGYDQGVHNHLLHAGRLDPVTCHDNAGPILTLGHKRETPPIDVRGDILNDAGEPAVMVHQYDRMEGLFRHVRKRF